MTAAASRDRILRPKFLGMMGHRVISQRMREQAFSPVRAVKT